MTLNYSLEPDPLPVFEVLDEELVVVAARAKAAAAAAAASFAAFLF